MLDIFFLSTNLLLEREFHMYKVHGRERSAGRHLILDWLLEFNDKPIFVQFHKSRVSSRLSLPIAHKKEIEKSESFKQMRLSSHDDIAFKFLLFCCF